ncbi:glycine betaine/proline transport system ATP-binding protein [Solibacillus kalamii]|uniref:Quaternary amine transport ATP-binding protein n=3 Tax=Solibacillus TaxID=648800 RepID=F2F9Z3_SOLSS|nr:MULTISPECIES: glycine betaine/L-proline ABC transporter ATP-binding protein [Solibacillus]AMO86310.1 glycine betaine/L-proline ABC transporter ATP-binding protein [Solibacillus silvestris]EKB45689.1 Glycine betaine/L-proline transport ATP-binding protein ProV [Solibacillus isronensis B3W22]MBM7664581.1 glycine betaine/proline transport system ATP-binding protein [Solibacillus kalamii]OUZ39671.1 glycine betaine/L-proline ABC transporter ATP-binding protein [Solibacillus kalamii]BAK15659.1 AB
MGKIKIDRVTKVFGKNTSQALKLVKQEKSKEQILKETNATVGVYEASLTIEEGEIFVIMGLSGSGKSTLIRLLNRLIQPTSGDIYIDDQNITKLNKKSLQVVRREKMSMVFQNFALFPQRTILQNAEYGLEIRGVPKEERRLKAEKALQNAGLLSYKDQYPDQLSGGMQQRVGLARALANDTEIILMDEAFSALDPLIRKEMQDELLELQANLQKTIVFITHDLNEALRIGDRIAIMKDGKIMQVGTGEEILTNPANEYVRSFLEDVDRSKVLTAENAMIRPMTIQIDHEGPKVALQRMREDKVSVLLAVDKARKYLGYITANDALELAQSGEKSLQSILRNDMPIVEPSTVIQDILSVISDSPTPLAVVEEGKLRGVLIRGVVLESLASEKNGGVDNE